MFNVREFLKQLVRVAICFVLVAGMVSVSLAWTGPSASPPTNNTSAPINVGATGQSKAGYLGVNGAAASYPLTVAGVASNWSTVINWPPASAPAGSYGILVGGVNYSQFQNTAGYYAQLAYSSWGMYTNGNVSAAGYYVNGNRFYGFGGIFDAQGAGYLNPITGARSCPAGYSAYPFLNDYTGCCNPYTWRTLYQCYQ